MLQQNPFTPGWGRGREREKVPPGGSSDQSLTTATTSASALNQGKALAGTGSIVPAVWDEDQAFLMAEICAQAKKKKTKKQHHFPVVPNATK